MDDFLFFAAVGFVAQLADGALGMGFGVISASVLLSQGVSPPLVSAAINAAKVPTGGAAALSHALHRNVDWDLAGRLALWGVAGGLVGALTLSTLKGPALHLLVSAYLVLIGLLILWRAITGHAPRAVATRRLGVLGLAGGAIEGIGGSWGPVVTSGLLGAGVVPRRAIGSSCTAELAVSLGVLATLTATYAVGQWGTRIETAAVLSSVAGLVAGGVPAALIGGRLAARVPRRPLAAAVGLLALGIAVQRLWALV